MENKDKDKKEEDFLEEDEEVLSKDEEEKLREKLKYEGYL